MSKNKQIVVSGIRPTGRLHLGNYFGAVKNFIKLQENYNSFFFVADYHYLTTHTDISNLQNASLSVVAEYIACGLDPNQCTLYLQSTVPEVAELYLYFNMLAYKGELEKTASFKEKIKKHKENINAGLLTYPVLMAADILIHRGDLVPVGKDQEQHLEMAKTFAKRFNHRCQSQIFAEPKAFNFGKNLTKIPSLDDTGKMSKSENKNATIYLTDSPKVIEKKIKKATTDQGPQQPNSSVPSSIENLFAILSICSDQETVSYFKEKYNDCSIKYGELKQIISDNLCKYLLPIQKNIKELMDNKNYIKDVINDGAIKSRASAKQTLALVRDALGFIA